MTMTGSPGTIIITKNLKSERVVGSVSYGVLSRYLDNLLAKQECKIPNGTIGGKSLCQPNLVGGA